MIPPTIAITLRMERLEDTPAGTVWRACGGGLRCARG